MNSIAALYADSALRLAQDRTDAYRREADNDRLANPMPGHSPLDGLRSAITSIRRKISSFEPEIAPVLPALRDYPYRG